jgi:hypothetical protein
VTVDAHAGDTDNGLSLATINKRFEVISDFDGSTAASLSATIHTAQPFRNLKVIPAAKNKG